MYTRTSEALSRDLLVSLSCDPVLSSEESHISSGRTIEDFYQIAETVLLLVPHENVAINLDIFTNSALHSEFMFVNIELNKSKKCVPY